MQVIRTLVLLAAVSEVVLADTDAADALDSRPHKKHERSSHSSRRALRHTSGDDTSLRRRKSKSVITQDDDEWASREGLLHLEAAEVETEAVQDLAAVEREDEREEHPELAKAEDQERRQVETQAAGDWSAVAQAASAEAVRMTQEAAVGGAVQVAAASALGAAPGPAPGPVDYSWAHKMVAAKPMPEQGFEGKMIQHMDFNTMTEDWQQEHVQSWSTLNEICAACARHPDNSWCRGKCPGTLARLGGRADEALAHAATATSDAAADASAAARRGGGSLQDRMPDTFPEAKLPGSDRMPDSFPEAELPGSDGKGSRGPPGGLGDVFRSKASGRALGLPLLLVAALLGLQ